MHKRERYLPHEGGAPQLGIEQGADGHRYRIIRERARNTEEKKVLDGCFAILEKKMRRDSQAPVTNCRNGGPCPPPACYGVEKNDAEKAEREASQKPVTFRKRHYCREHRLEIRRRERDKAEQEHRGPTYRKLKRTCGYLELHGIPMVPHQPSSA